MFTAGVLTGRPKEQCYEWGNSGNFPADIHSKVSFHPIKEALLKKSTKKLAVVLDA